LESASLGTLVKLFAIIPHYIVCAGCMHSKDQLTIRSITLDVKVGKHKCGTSKDETRLLSPATFGSSSELDSAHSNHNLKVF